MSIGIKTVMEDEGITRLETPRFVGEIITRRGKDDFSCCLRADFLLLVCKQEQQGQHGVEQKKANNVQDAPDVERGENSKHLSFPQTLSRTIVTSPVI
jgi:hypothetical protein